MRVYAYKHKDDAPGDPFDFCRECARSIDVADDLPEQGYVDLDRDCDHPPYEDTDYHCDMCGVKLTGKDD